MAATNALQCAAVGRYNAGSAALMIYEMRRSLPGGGVFVLAAVCRGAKRRHFQSRCRYKGSGLAVIARHHRTPPSAMRQCEMFGAVDYLGDARRFAAAAPCDVGVLAVPRARVR